MFGKKMSLTVTGMSCSHCEQAVEMGLTGLSSVSKVKANHNKDCVTLHYKGEIPDLDEAVQRVRELGYEPGDAWVQLLLKSTANRS